MFTYTAEQHVGTEDSDAAPAIEARDSGRSHAGLPAVAASRGGWPVHPGRLGRGRAPGLLEAGAAWVPSWLLPPVVVQVAATEKGRTTACLLVDEPAQLLWVADKDGWVYGERQLPASQMGGSLALSLPLACCLPPLQLQAWKASAEATTSSLCMLPCPAPQPTTLAASRG